MKTLALVGLLMLLWMGWRPAPLMAQPDHIFTYSMTPTETPTPTTASIDKAQSDCLDSAKTLSRTCACLEASRVAWQAELDKALAKFQTALSGTAGADAMRQTQTDWSRYRDGEFAYLDLVFAENPIQAAKVEAAKAELIAARAREVDAVLSMSK
jgi:uncharacterized protein YecT (DUF1311 family)